MGLEGILKKVKYWGVGFFLMGGLMFSGSNVLSQKKKEDFKNYIAVLGLDCSKGISRETCGALTDRLRSEIVGGGKYTIIDRAHQRKILKEWKFQLSDYTIDNVIKMGNVLNVGKIVVGKVRKLEEDTCYMYAEMIGVENGKVEKSADGNTGCKARDLLGLGSSVSNDLMGLKKGATLQGEVKKKVGISGVLEKKEKRRVWDIVGSFPSPGRGPTGLTFDGVYLWSASWYNNRGDYKIYKINPSNGEVVDSFPSPGRYSPMSLAFDGTYLWSTDRADKTYKFNPSNGKVVDSFPPGPGGFGLAFDGTYLWDATARDDKIYKLNPSNGKVVDSFPSPGPAPTGLAFDGTYLWNADGNHDKIYKLNPSNGKVVDSFPSPGDHPWGLTFDGTYLWNVDWHDKKIYKIRVK